jgi:hypothetical protein
VHVKIQAPKAKSSGTAGFSAFMNTPGAAKKANPGDLAPGTDRTPELLTPGLL